MFIEGVKLGAVKPGREGVKMKSLLLSFVTGVYFLLVSPTAQAQQVEAPSYNEGDKWRVSWEFNTRSSRSDMLPEGVYNVFYKSGKFLWCPSKQDAPIGKPCSDPWEGLREEEAVMFFGKYERGVPFLAFPLNIGDTRTYKYDRMMGGGRRQRKVELEGKVSVTAVEKVKIGASELAAYKHAMKEEGENVSRVYDYYYSPDCKCIARLSAVFGSGSSYSLEVLSYETKP